MPKCNSCEFDDHSVGCDDESCDCICNEWFRKLLADGFYVRNLSVQKGASLLTQAGVPLDVDEKNNPRGFGLTPYSSLSFYHRTKNVWTITWSYGSWTGKP